MKKKVKQSKHQLGSKRCGRASIVKNRKSVGKRKKEQTYGVSMTHDEWQDRLHSPFG